MEPIFPDTISARDAADVTDKSEANLVAEPQNEPVHRHAQLWWALVAALLSLSKYKCDKCAPYFKIMSSLLTKGVNLHSLDISRSTKDATDRSQLANERLRQQMNLHLHRKTNSNFQCPTGFFCQRSFVYLSMCRLTSRSGFGAELQHITKMGRSIWETEKSEWIPLVELLSCCLTRF